MEAHVPATKFPKCPTHTQREILYTCMDLACTKTPSCCILCVKNDHSSCNDTLLVENSEMSDKVQLQNVSGSQMLTFREDIRNLLQEMHAYMSQKFKKFTADSLVHLAAETLTLKQISDADTLKGLKEHCNIVVNGEGKIVVSQKIDPNSPTIKEDIRGYKEEIRGLIDEFNKSLAGVYFNTGNAMALSEFTWHKNLGKGVFIAIGRRQSFVSSKLFTIYTP